MKKVYTLLVAALLSVSAWADDIKTQTLFTSPDAGTTVGDDNPTHRIPAIVKTKSGMLVAICDERRSTNGGDIGSGRIDLVYKTSTDNGRTWSEKKTLAQGTKDCAYGDAAVICDSKTGKILVMCAGGKISYAKSTADKNSSSDKTPYSKAIKFFRIIGTETNGDITWTEPEDKTKYMYDLYRDGSSSGWGETYTQHVWKAFFSSGSLCQSTVKDDKRIYGALVTNRGTLVVYTTDLGETWNYLGNKQDKPAEYGDEGKLAELPNGDVVLSARHNDGKHTFNVWDDDKNKWRGSDNIVRKSDDVTTAFADCNGEIMVLPNGSDYIDVFMSIPASKSRENLSVFHRSLPIKDGYSVADFIYYTGWKAYPLSTTTSAYSAMTIDANGDVAILYEENQKDHSKVSSYDIKFKTIKAAELAWNGRVVTIESSNFRQAKKDQYLNKLLTRTKDESNNVQLTNVDRDENGTFNDYSYYWVINRDPNDTIYYISSYDGDGYIGLNNETGVAEFTTDYNKALKIRTFDKYGENKHKGYAAQNPTEEVNGVAFKYTDPAESRDDKNKWVCVSEKGVIGKFDHTTQGDESSSVYYTTDFLIKDVTPTTTANTYGAYATPEHFGWKVTFTRHDDSYKPLTYEDFDYYATLRLPFAVLLPENIHAYQVTKKVNNGEVGLTELNLASTTGGKILPRETPVLLKMTRTDNDADVQKTVYLMPCEAQTIQATGFQGTLGKQTFANYDPNENHNYYILSKKNGRVAFRWMNNTTLAANKAYYIFDGDATKINALSFIFDDTTTSVTPIISTPATENGAIYDLSGRRVNQMNRKGIYIQNGKKVLVK